MEARRSRLDEMTLVGEWLKSGDPYLIAQAGMLIASHDDSGPLRSAPFVHPSLQSCPPAAAAALNRHEGPSVGDFPLVPSPSAATNSTAPLVATVPTVVPTTHTLIKTNEGIAMSSFSKRSNIAEESALLNEPEKALQPRNPSLRPSTTMDI
jgi:hypothetical protein